MEADRLAESRQPMVGVDMRRMWKAAAAAVALGWGSAASAHELTCEKRVDGQQVLTVSTYPTTVTFGFRVDNVHPTETSVMMRAEDGALMPWGWEWPFPLPQAIAVKDFVTHSFELELRSFEECELLASGGGMAGGTSSVTFDNTFRVTWELGETQCRARLVCQPEQTPPCESGCEGGTTRTMGFFKTHEQALTQCLSAHGGSISLGFVTVDSLEEALGLLWGSPARYEQGGKRSELDQKRFLLARQTLVGLCNQELFGTPTTPPDLLGQAVSALSGTDCGTIASLIGPVDAYNNSGTGTDFPEGFTKGPATPGHAHSIADDPTGPSGLSCGG
jgi:hypothetical protein